MRADSEALSRISLPDLRTLEHAIQGNRVSCPLTESALLSIGLGHATSPLLTVLVGLNQSGVEAVLAATIAERIHRPPPRLDLVWTGPEARSATTRDTAIVVRQLFEQAANTVLVGGFAFDHGEHLLRPLHEGMKARGVKATLFLEIADHAATPAGADEHSVKVIDKFFAENWPFGDPRPDVYYDPRTAVAGPPWASLHAKCVVIDDCKTFITSANFTDRGQTRNIEAGVLIDDREFALRVVAQWRGLVDGGLVHRYRG